MTTAEIPKAQAPPAASMGVIGGTVEVSLRRPGLPEGSNPGWLVRSLTGYGPDMFTYAFPLVAPHSFSLWTSYDLTRDWTKDGPGTSTRDRTANHTNDGTRNDTR